MLFVSSISLCALHMEDQTNKQTNKIGKNNMMLMKIAVDLVYGS